MRRVLNRRRLTALALAIVAFGVARPGTAASDIESPFSFVLAFIGSVNEAHVADSYYWGLEKSDPLTLQGLNDHRMANASAQARFSDAAALVAPFGNSKSETIKLSANAALAAYTRLITATRQSLEELERAYTSFREAQHEAQVLLARASAFACHALVLMPDSKAEKLSRLTITAEERRSLLQTLERSFGPTVTKYVEEDRRAAPAPAMLLYEFLSQTWKSSDEK